MLPSWRRVTTGPSLAKLGCRLAINAEIVTSLPANHCGIEDGLERPLLPRMSTLRANFILPDSASSM